MAYTLVTVGPGGSGADYSDLSTAVATEAGNIGTIPVDAPEGGIEFELWGGAYPAGNQIVEEFSVTFEMQDYFNPDSVQAPTKWVKITVKAGEEAKGRYKGGTSATAWDETGDFAAPTLRLAANWVYFNLGAGQGVVDCIFDKSASGALFADSPTSDPSEAWIIRRCTLVHTGTTTPNCLSGLRGAGNKSGGISFCVAKSREAGSYIGNHRYYDSANNSMFWDDLVPAANMWTHRDTTRGSFYNNLGFVIDPNTGSSLDDFGFSSGTQLAASPPSEWKKNTTLFGDNFHNPPENGLQDVVAGYSPTEGASNSWLTDVAGGDFTPAHANLNTGYSEAAHVGFFGTVLEDTPKTIDLQPLPALGGAEFPIGAWSYGAAAPSPPTFDGSIANQSDVENAAITPLDITGEFSENGGANPTYTMQAGTLPTGITLSTAGVFSGTPTTVETRTGLVVRLTTGEGTADSNTFQWEITAASTPHNVGGGAISFTLNLTGGSIEQTHAIGGGAISYTHDLVGGGISQLTRHYVDGGAISYVTDLVGGGITQGGQHAVGGGAISMAMGLSGGTFQQSNRIGGGAISVTWNLTGGEVSTTLVESPPAGPEFVDLLDSNPPDATNSLLVVQQNGPGELLLTATGFTDAESGIDPNNGVEFFDGAGSIGFTPDSAEPWTITFATTPGGNYSFTARAYDLARNQSGPSNTVSWDVPAVEVGIPQRLINKTGNAP